MRRRTFLRSAPLVGLSAPLVGLTLTGCLGRARVSEQSAGAASGGVARAVLDMSAIEPSKVPERLFGVVEKTDESTRARVLRAVAANETATVETIRPRIEDGERIVFDGTLYRITSRITDRKNVGVYPIILNDLAYDSVTVGPNDERVTFRNLPAADRTVFEREGYADGDPLGIGTSFVYTDRQADRSALVSPEQPTVIDWASGPTGRFTLRGEVRDETLVTYEYSGEVVVSSTAAYGKRLRRKYGLTLSDVSSAEADILEAAIENDDGYAVPVGTTPGDAFTALADRFATAKNVETLSGDTETNGNDDPRAGTYLVTYEGALYWTRLSASDWGTTTDETATDETATAEPTTTGTATGETSTDS